MVFVLVFKYNEIAQLLIWSCNPVKIILRAIFLLCFALVLVFTNHFYVARKIFSIFLPLANSSINLSMYLVCFVKGVSISSMR